MSDLSGPRRPNPPQLTTAASLVAVQGGLLLLLAVIGLVGVSSARISVGVSTAVFFAAYGAVLVVSALGLARRQGWTRGPVLMTQLIQLGLAWNLREYALVAILMAVAAVVVIAGVVSPASIAALSDDPESR